MQKAFYGFHAKPLVASSCHNSTLPLRQPTMGHISEDEPHHSDHEDMPARDPPVLQIRIAMMMKSRPVVISLCPVINRLPIVPALLISVNVYRIPILIPPNFRQSGPRLRHSMIS